MSIFNCNYVFKSGKTLLVGGLVGSFMGAVIPGAGVVVGAVIGAGINSLFQAAEWLFSNGKRQLATVESPLALSLLPAAPKTTRVVEDEDAIAKRAIIMAKVAGETICVLFASAQVFVYTTHADEYKALGQPNYTFWWIDIGGLAVATIVTFGLKATTIFKHPFAPTAMGAALVKGICSYTSAQTALKALGLGKPTDQLNITISSLAGIGAFLAEYCKYFVYGPFHHPIQAVKRMRNHITGKASAIASAEQAAPMNNPPIPWYRVSFSMVVVSFFTVDQVMIYGNKIAKSTGVLPSWVAQHQQFYLYTMYGALLFLAAPTVFLTYAHKLLDVADVKLSVLAVLLASAKMGEAWMSGQENLCDFSKRCTAHEIPWYIQAVSATLATADFLSEYSIPMFRTREFEEYLIGGIKKIATKMCHAITSKQDSPLLNEEQVLVTPSSPLRTQPLAIASRFKFGAGVTEQLSASIEIVGESLSTSVAEHRVCGSV